MNTQTLIKKLASTQYPNEKVSGIATQLMKDIRHELDGIARYQRETAAQRVKINKAAVRLDILKVALRNAAYAALSPVNDYVVLAACQYLRYAIHAQRKRLRGLAKEQRLLRDKINARAVHLVEIQTTARVLLQSYIDKPKS